MTKVKKMIELLHKIPLLKYSLILLVISMLLFIPTDPDFFWHLKYGELTLAQGPLSHNPLTFTFQDYSFVDFEWLSNLVIFILFKLQSGKFHLLALLYGIIVLAALVISLNIVLIRKAKKGSKSIMLFVGTIMVLPTIGIRPQMVTLLGLSLTYYLLIKYLKGNKKMIFLMPIIMAIWTNLHPGFLSGLILLIVITSAEIVKSILRKVSILNTHDSIYQDKKPKVRTLILITGLSILATLLTPYLHKLLAESFLFSFDTYAQETISEWLAPNFHKFSGKCTVFYLLFVIISFFRRKDLNLTEIFLTFTFGIMTFQSIRHLPLLVIVTIPSILQSKDWQKLAYFNFKEPFFLFVKLLFFITAIAATIPLFTRFMTVNADVNKVYEKAEYPTEAVDFLKQQNYEGNLFNNYEWGGFLDWYYPEKKTFIDGRMTSWKMDGKRALEEYDDIANLQASDWKERLESYGIKIVLVKDILPIGNALRESEDWEIVYESDLAQVLKKKT